jgi:gamma-glutamylcyclotransferase (GGCT)/AIG2-like uncharacterized protein YtfP
MNEVAKGKLPVENLRVEITEQTPEVLMCVYGTLRQGEGNWGRHLRNTNSEYLGTYKTEPKFTLYGRRMPFPSLAPHGNTSVVYEVFKVKDKRVLEGLHNLEGCTGVPGHNDNWYDIIPIETPHGQGWIYVHHAERESPEVVIVSGDWKNKSV